MATPTIPPRKEVAPKGPLPPHAHLSSPAKASGRRICSRADIEKSKTAQSKGTHVDFKKAHLSAVLNLELATEAQKTISDQIRLIKTASLEAEMYDPLATVLTEYSSEHHRKCYVLWCQRM